MGRRYNRIKILVKEDRTPYTGKRDLFGGWRKKIIFESEWTPVAGSIANSTGTTFISTVDNSTLLHVTGLGGVEGTPKTATIDFGFGDTLEVPAPAFNLLGLQGYAPPLANIQRKKDQEEDERIDAEIRKLEEQIKQVTEQQNDLFEEEKSTMPEYTGWSEAEYADKVNEINGRYSDILAPYFKNMTGKFGTGFGSASDAERKRAYAKAAELEPAQTAELNKLADEYKSQTDAFVKARDAHYAAYNKRNLTLETQKDALNIQIVKLEKQRPINKQLDASQEAYPYLPLMNARVQSAAGSRQNGYKYSYQDGPPGAGGVPIMAIAMGLKSFGSDNVAAQQAYPTSVRTGQGGRSLGSTTQRQGGAINPSTPAPSATGMSFSDLANVVNQYSQYNQYSQDNLAKNDVPPKMNARVDNMGMINPTAATSALASAIRKLGDPVADALGAGDAKDVFDYYMNWAEKPNSKPVNLTNKISPEGQAYLQKLAGDPSVQGLSGMRKAAALNDLYVADLESGKIPLGLRNILGMPDVNKGDGFNVDKNGKVTVSKAYDFTNYSDIGGTNIATGIGAMSYALSQGIGKHLGVPFIGGKESPTMNININVAAPSANANSLGQRGPGGGMTDSQIKAAQDRANAARRAGKMSDIRGSQANRSNSANANSVGQRGSQANRSNSANANSVGQRGSDGGMTDAQIKAAQDKANAARRAGKMSDIRGSQANKGFASDPKTGEPRYTGMNNRQYADAANKIADKYNKLRAPIERQYAEFSGQQAPASLMNKLNALNDAQTAEEDALAAKRAAQENAFNDALQDYNDKQDAANQARQDALDEIDNEEDPYSKLLAELGVKMEKLRREGKSVKRVEIIGPGEEGYVDTTNMANAIGYNRRIIYTAEAKALQKEIIALQDAQMKWYNNRQKRREDAEKADYSDAGGSSGSSGKGGRQFGGQGGLPIGTTTLRGGAGDSAGARKPTPPENMSQSAALARQAASARMNRQQKRKRGLLTQSTTWDRINKYRFIKEHQTP